MVTTARLEQFTSLVMPCGIKPSQEMMGLIERGAVLMRHSDGGWNEYWFRSQGIFPIPGVPEGSLILWMPSDGMWTYRPWGDMLECMADLDNIDDPQMIGWFDEFQIEDEEH